MRSLYAYVRQARILAHLLAELLPVLYFSCGMPTLIYFSVFLQPSHFCAFGKHYFVSALSGACDVFDTTWCETFMIILSQVFIQRLEVECALRAQLPDLPACTHPPPIHLELTHKEEARLMKNVPKDFLCPVSLEIMIEPVVSPSGVTYNR